MKKLSARKLVFHSETVRALTSNQLVLVGGGLRTAIPTHADACTFNGGGACTNLVTYAPACTFNGGGGMCCDCE